MPIIEDDIDKLKSFLSLYQFPLILATIGIIFLLVGLIVGFRTLNTSSGVVFTESSASARAKIQIDVAGAVIAPGVYIFYDGDRITQALSAAGGLHADADRDWIAKYMNLAAKLTDGGKIYIPSAAGATPGKPSNNLSDLSNPSNLLGVTTGKVNINTSLQIELEKLPGIGPVTAGKIITGRPYQSVEELKSRKIIGNALFEKIQNLIVTF